MMADLGMIHALSGIMRIIAHVRYRTMAIQDRQTGEGGRRMKGQIHSYATPPNASNPRINTLLFTRPDFHTILCYPTS